MTTAQFLIELFQSLGIITLALSVFLNTRSINNINRAIYRILSSGWFPKPREERK